MNDNPTDGLNPDWQLPAPPRPAREHSQGLTELVCARIHENGGNISFDRYMEMVLYEPGWGYYSAGATRFGESGDFVTAPLVSPLFSRCVARQCRQVLASMDSGDILELGAGPGVMALDLLLELEALETLPDRYFILETSADLRIKQKQLYTSRIPHLLPRIKWLDTLPGNPVNGVIIANEVVDALPVTRVLLEKGVLHELCVGHDGDEFYWVRTPLPSAPVRTAWDRVAGYLAPQLHERFETEICLRGDAWFGSVSSVLDRGMVLLIDYGYPRYEYYHPQRDKGTLLCHYRHRFHDDPFFYPGLQDITASVDFTALALSALDNGMRLAGYTSQAHFLIGCGLAEIAAGGKDCPDPAVSGQVKRLTLPGEMGERFKAIAFTRNFTEPLLGFQFIDRQEQLWKKGQGQESG